MIKGNPIKIQLKTRLKKALSKILKFPKSKKTIIAKKLETPQNLETFEDWFPHENF